MKIDGHCHCGYVSFEAEADPETTAICNCTENTMTVTVVTRWTAPNVAASTDIAKRSKALWMKNGAQNVRLNQIFTGPYTGQWLFVVMFDDMAAYAKISAAVTGGSDLQKLIAANAKIGAVMQEREILVGIDI